MYKTSHFDENKNYYDFIDYYRERVEELFELESKSKNWAALYKIMRISVKFTNAFDEFIESFNEFIETESYNTYTEK